MRYLHQVIKVRKDATVTVHFDQPTNVYLLTRMNYKRYKDTKSFRYIGGHKEDSPVTYTIPADGEWHVIIEKGTYSNPLNVTASIEVDNNGVQSKASSDEAISYEEQIKARKERNARIAEARRKKAEAAQAQAAVDPTPPAAEEEEEAPAAEAEAPEQETEATTAEAESHEEHTEEEKETVMAEADADTNEEEEEKKD